MNEKCRTCKWWAEDEMSCMNAHNDVFMSGPGGSCEQWSAFIDGEPVNNWLMERFMKVN